MKASVLVILGVVAVLGTPASALAQKDGAAPPGRAPGAAPRPKAGAPATPAAPTAAPTTPAPVQATAPSKSPAALPTPAAATASAPTGATAAPAGQRYTWCSAITAPPLQRWFSGVFLAPADTTIDLTAGFGEAIKANHHPRPQDMSCNPSFPTREAAEEARAQKVPATGVAWRLPALSVDWAYVRIE